MSERKVLNKYYPADYDPSKIPRAKRPKNRQWTIRTMAPFNMRCNTCGEYIYKGKKFNSRQEVAEGEYYLTMKIFRFYIKCPKCVSEITFKTDPQSLDYVLEAGATRNFEALRTAELMAQKEAAEKEAELENNPMKMLENRTKASQREMDMLETLEDLRELNSRHQKLDMDGLIAEKVEQQRVAEERRLQQQEEEDEAFVRSIFSKDGQAIVRRLEDSDEDEGDKAGLTPAKQARLAAPTDHLLCSTDEATPSTSGSGVKSNGVASTATSQLAGVVKAKKNPLGLLVKKKDTASTKTSTVTSTGVRKPSLYELVKKKQAEEANNKNCTKDESQNKSTENEADILGSDCRNGSGTAPTNATGTSALGLLGGYSDSDASSEND